MIQNEQDLPPITVEVTYTPLFNRRGDIISVVANIDDITRFRAAEELKSTFISVVSHELKTPVALIKGYADTLRREDARWDEKTMRESLGIIVEESDHLNHLINNLLEASRIQAGGLALTPGHFQLPPVIEKLVAGFKLQTDAHQFEIDFPSDFPLVYGDEERIKEVLSNLLGNAVKYSPDGGVISVGGRADGKWITVYVADSGVGISPEERGEHLRPLLSRGKPPIATHPGDRPRSLPESCDRRSARGTYLGREHARKGLNLRLHVASALAV